MKAYYGSRISENMTRTPEGYLICQNVPIARTGSQQYLRSELGILDEDPNGIVDVLREEGEVFAPATIASFEGKPVTDEHPPDSVSLETFTAYACGHAQNVRRGVGEESDCIVADLFITSPKLIEAIEQGRREISCGYDCQYEEAGGHFFQRAIRGNHVAVVPAGRAGHRVAIKDSATEQTNHERGNKTMANKPKNHSLFAKLFSHAVKDMEPDEVADAIEEISQSGADKEAAPPPAPAAAPAADEGSATLEGVMAAVKGVMTTVAALTEKVNTLCAARDKETPPEAPVDEDPLKKLADELAAVAGNSDEKQPVDEEAAATIPADELPETTDEDGPVAAANTLPQNPIPGADKAIALGALNALRPVIAVLPKEQRKAASDKAIAEIRKLIGKDAKPQSNGYNDVNAILRQASKGKAKDSKPAADQSKIGQSIMAARNPHYKK